MLPSFINFAFPLMLTSLMMQSYTIADGLILGNLVNERALGAVNSISPLSIYWGLSKSVFPAVAPSASPI